MRDDDTTTTETMREPLGLTPGETVRETVRESFERHAATVTLDYPARDPLGLE